MSGDNPIRSSADDRLGRSAFADHLSAALLAEAADEGLVAALVGPWGQGKSSVVNMVKEQLGGTHSRTVLTFSPWMFSGRDQLVAAFFEQVAGQLRLRGKAERDLADRLIAYGQALSPLVFVPGAGAWFARIGALATAIGQARSARRPDPIEQQRQAIEAALGKLADPIFVVIDDLDRLTGPEVRDMLALVRLTAHFPKIIYLLAFDRSKVERALDQDGLEDGRSYLDKIIELSFDLPATSRPALNDVLVDGLAKAIEGIETGPFDETRWPDVFARVVRPLLSTPRDVNRYLAALPAGLRMIGDEVALVDVLALEAIRLRLPDVFANLGSMGQALTDVGMFTSQMPGWRDRVVAFAEAGQDHAEVVSDLCRLLFPATERYLGTSNVTYPSNWLRIWRKQRRVANPEVLAIYLSKQLPPGVLPAAIVDLAIIAMASEQVFKGIVASLPAEGLDDLLARLTAYEDDISPAVVLPACTVLLGLYPRLRAQAKGFFDAPPEYVIDGIVLRLLRRIDDITERTRIVETLCANVDSLAGRIRLLHIAGRRPNPDTDRLIPAAESDRLYHLICTEIRHVTTAQLIEEHDPLLLLATALAEDPADRENIDRLLRDDTCAAALLLSAPAQIRGQALGSLAIQTEQVLRWQLLGTVVGDDKEISAVVDRVAVVRQDDAAAAVIALARRYQTGWRPPMSPFGAQEPVRRQAFNAPNMIFSPSVTSDGWPALLIRAVTTFEVDPAWADQVDVSGGEFHDRLAALLAGGQFTAELTALAAARDLPTDLGSWVPDPEIHQSSRAAVQRLTIGPADQPTAVLRYAVFMSDNSGPMKVMADIALSPREATDAKWGQLGLEEIRDATASALTMSAGPIADEMLRSIYSGEIPPRTAVELYIWSGQGQSGARSSGTLNSVIDLDALGTPTRPDQHATQGIYAVAGDTPTGTAQDRRNLIVHALIRLALDWGYLDARPKLAALAS